MAKGASKLAGGGGAAGGAQQTPNKPTDKAVDIKDIGDPALKTTMQDIVQKNLFRKTYTHAQSVKDGKVIEKSTNTGDSFIFHGNNGQVVTYVKKGANSWQDSKGQFSAFASDGMARIISGLDYTGGSWKYKKKK